MRSVFKIFNNNFSQNKEDEKSVSSPPIIPPSEEEIDTLLKEAKNAIKIFFEDSDVTDSTLQMPVEIPKAQVIEAVQALEKARDEKKELPLQVEAIIRSFILNCLSELLKSNSEELQPAIVKIFKPFGADLSKCGDLTFEKEKLKNKCSEEIENIVKCLSELPEEERITINQKAIRVYNQQLQQPQEQLIELSNSQAKALKEAFDCLKKLYDEIKPNIENFIQKVHEVKEKTKELKEENTSLCSKILMQLQNIQGVSDEIINSLMEAIKKLQPDTKNDLQTQSRDYNEAITRNNDLKALQGYVNQLVSTLKNLNEVDEQVQAFKEANKKIIEFDPSAFLQPYQDKIVSSLQTLSSDSEADFSKKIEEASNVLKHVDDELSKLDMENLNDLVKNLKTQHTLAQTYGKEITELEKKILEKLQSLQPATNNVSAQIENLKNKSVSIQTELENKPTIANLAETVKKNHELISQLQWIENTLKKLKNLVDNLSQFDSDREKISADLKALGFEITIDELRKEFSSLYAFINVGEFLQEDLGKIEALKVDEQHQVPELYSENLNVRQYTEDARTAIFSHNGFQKLIIKKWKKQQEPNPSATSHWKFEFNQDFFNFLLGYDLSLMSITSCDKLDTSKLDKKPYLIKDDQGKYQIWGYKENKWQLTDIGNLEIDFEWKQGQTVFISPKGGIFNTLKKGHTQEWRELEKQVGIAKEELSRAVGTLKERAYLGKSLRELQGHQSHRQSGFFGFFTFNKKIIEKRKSEIDQLITAVDNIDQNKSINDVFAAWTKSDQEYQCIMEGRITSGISSTGFSFIKKIVSTQLAKEESDKEVEELAKIKSSLIFKIGRVTGKKVWFGKGEFEEKRKILNDLMKQILFNTKNGKEIEEQLDDLNKPTTISDEAVRTNTFTLIGKLNKPRVFKCFFSIFGSSSQRVIEEAKEEIRRFISKKTEPIKKM